MVILAGPEGPGIYFQVLAAQAFQFLPKYRTELCWCPVLDAFAKPFLSSGTPVLLFPGAALQSLEAHLLDIQCIALGDDMVCQDLMGLF